MRTSMRAAPVARRCVETFGVVSVAHQFVVARPKEERRLPPPAWFDLSLSPSLSLSLSSLKLIPNFSSLSQRKNHTGVSPSAPSPSRPPSPRYEERKRERELTLVILLVLLLLSTALLWLHARFSFLLSPALFRLREPAALEKGRVPVSALPLGQYQTAIVATWGRKASSNATLFIDG